LLACGSVPTLFIYGKIDFFFIEWFIKKMNRLPEEIIQLIWQYDGRYIQAMKEIHEFLESFHKKSFAYNREIRNRIHSFERRMDDMGHIRGVTDKHKPGLIRKFKFHDIIGSYRIIFNKRCNRAKEIEVDGILYQSVQRFPVVLFDSTKYKPIFIEKCGIEVLNTRWLQRARRRKDATHYIQLHMAI